MQNFLYENEFDLHENGYAGETHGAFNSPYCSPSIFNHYLESLALKQDRSCYDDQNVDELCD